MLRFDEGAPRHGWTVLTVFDALEDASKTGREDLLLCEACGVREVRYVHVLDHPAYTRSVFVGSECAGRMSGESKAAVRARESAARNRSARRSTFCSNKNWTPTRRGGWRLRHLGHFYLLLPGTYGGWSAGYKIDDDRPGAKMVFLPEFFLHLTEAKLAVFDAVHPGGGAGITRGRVAMC